MNKNIILIGLVLGVVFISGCIKQPKNIGLDPRDYPRQTQELCESSGAQWKMFVTGCHDECWIVRSTELIVCTEALSKGCDCGPSMCWNGTACESN